MMRWSSGEGGGGGRENMKCWKEIDRYSIYVMIIVIGKIENSVQKYKSRVGLGKLKSVLVEVTKWGEEEQHIPSIFTITFYVT